MQPTLHPDDLIHYYHLLPHPEGGLYRETYRAGLILEAYCTPTPIAGPRNASTAIYFLLRAGDFSAFHRIQSDELWHFYAGGTLEIVVILTTGDVEIIRLGNNILEGETFQAVVPAGCWFASRPVAGAAYSFVGCTVAPGFDFADFELADRHLLTQQYPQHNTIIQQLCR